MIIPQIVADASARLQKIKHDVHGNIKGADASARLQRTSSMCKVIITWSRLSGLNRRPTVYKTVALPAELSRQ